MIKLSVKTDVINDLQNFQENMLPYAISSTLTKLVNQSWQVLNRDIPVRFPGRGGMPWVMKGLKTEAATKKKLQARVYFTLDQSNILSLHEFGGPKTPHNIGGHFAVPIAPELRRPGKRIPDYLRPKWLLGADRKGNILRSDFSMRMARRAQGERIRMPKRLKMFGAGSLSQQGFLLKTGAGKWYIVTRSNKGIIKFWYYLAPVVNIKDKLLFSETAAKVVQNNMQSIFDSEMRNIARRFAARERGPLETTTAYE